MDLENGKEYKKIKRDNAIYGLKKIKDENLGECLICSEENNIISIYNINNKEDDIDDDNDPFNINYDDEEEEKKNDDDDIEDRY